MWPNSQFPADLVTFTEKILNGKLLFLFSDSYSHKLSKFHNYQNSIIEYFDNSRPRKNLRLGTSKNSLDM